MKMEAKLLNQKGNFSLLTGVIILIIVALGAYFLFGIKGSQDTNQKQTLQPSQTPQVTLPPIQCSLLDGPTVEDLPYTVAFIRDGSLWLYQDGAQRQLTKGVTVINTVTNNGEAPQVRYKFSKDGKTLYYEVFEYYKHDDNDPGRNLPLSIHAINLETGQDSVAVEESSDPKLEQWNKTLGIFDISHNGQKMAYTQDGNIYIKDLPSGNTTIFMKGSFYNTSTDPVQFGHSYYEVHWSPTDTFLFASWGGYESGGEEIINVATKNIISHEFEFSGFNLSFNDFINDSTGIFAGQTISADGNVISAALIESNFPQGKNKKEVPLYLPRKDQAQHLEIQRVEYSPLDNRIYFNQRSQDYVDKNQNQTRDSFFDEIVYFDRSSNKSVNLTNDSDRAINVSERCRFKDTFSVSSDSKYIAYNFGTDIWIISRDGKQKGILLKDALGPVFTR